MNHGTKVLMDLIQPWTMANRLVCADSYFSSVQTAINCRNKKTKYIGVVKTATKNYPMKALAEVELGSKGDRYPLVSLDAEGKPELLLFVWKDRQWHYFIVSGSSIGRRNAAILRSNSTTCEG